MASKSDHEILSDLQTGKRNALGELFDRYSPALYEFIYRVTGDRDQAARLLEEVFARAPASITAVGAHESVRGWLYGLAREIALAFLRQKGWLDTLPPSSEPSVSGIAGDIWRAARSIPAFHRAVLIAEELHGLSPTEKAHALSVARTDLPRLLDEARHLFENQFDIQARQQNRPLSSQIDPERIWGMHRRLGINGSLFGYLPVVILPDSLAVAMRAKVIASARIAASVVPTETAGVSLEVAPATESPVAQVLQPEKISSACSLRLILLALLTALVVTILGVGGFLLYDLLTRDTTAPTITRLEPAENAVLPYNPTAGSTLTRTLIQVGFRDDRTVEAKSPRLVLDGLDVTERAQVTASQITYSADLTSGQHSAQIKLRDTAGNETTRVWQFAVAGPPEPTRTPTRTPTITPTFTPAPPTRTPTLTPTGTAIPPPGINIFSANQTMITRGTPVLLTWNVSGADQVFLNQEKVEAAGTKLVSPTATTTYQLLASGPGGVSDRVVTVVVQDLPDLVVTDIALAPSNLISFTIRNIGAGDVTRPFAIQVIANSLAVYTASPVSSLPAGQSAQLLVPNYVVLGTQVVSVRVNALQEVQETNYANNELVRTLVGPTPTPTFTPTFTPSPTPTFTPSPTPTNTPTNTPTLTPVPGIVTSITITANPTTYTGTCPALVGFTATITMSGPGTVTYRWERSDAAVKPSQTITFLRADVQIVNDYWDAPPTGAGWQRLRVGSPNDTTSANAAFTNNCK